MTGRDDLIRRRAGKIIVRWAEPYPDEPPHGFMMRVAELHKQPSATKFAQHIGFEAVTEVTTCMAALDASVLAMPRHLEALSRWVPGAAEETATGGAWRVFAGQTVRRDDWSVATRRFCPACLAEDKYHRAWFDLTFMDVCPFHGDDIGDQAPDGNTVRFAVSSIDQSFTGCRLTREGPRLTGVVRSLEAYTLARLGLYGHWPAPLLDGLHLGEAVALCELVGTACLGGHRWTRPGPEELGASMGAIRAAGFEILDGGREAVVAAFRAVGDRAPTGTYGARKLFGWVYDHFHILGDWSSPVRELLMQAAYELGRAGTRRMAEWRGTGDYVTLSMISRHHDVHRTSIQAIAQAFGCLEGGDAKGSPFRIPAAHLPGVVAAFDWALKRPAAADALGVDSDVMNYLVRHGHVSGSWRGLDGDTAERFHFGDLLAFVESLPCTRIAEDDPVLGLDPAPVPLASALTRLRHTVPDLVGKILTGDVELVSTTDSPGSLGDLLIPPQGGVHRSALTPLFATWALRVSKAPPSAMSSREACTILNISAETVAVLIDRGYLSRIPGKDAGTSVSVDRSSVERFRSSYLAGKLYADALGCRTNHLRGAAEAAGVFDLLWDVRRDAKLRDVISVVYEREALSGLFGFRPDPDEAMPGYLAWTRFATHLGLGKSGFMVWGINGQREAVCAMHKLQWRVRFAIGEPGPDGVCAVTATLSLGKRDQVDVRAIMAATATRRQPERLVFELNAAGDRIDASLVARLDRWTADPGATEATEDVAFDVLTGMLSTLRTFFGVGTSPTAERDLQAA